jgi:hypothetical protein
MLRRYRAQLNGTEIIWLDQPPAHLVDARVLVVVVDDDSVLPAEVSTGTSAGTSTTNTIPARYNLTDLVGRLEWLGNAGTAQRAQRDAW